MNADPTRELARQILATLDAKGKASLDALLGPELTALWLPEPTNKPQIRAYYSKADLLLYGGSPGGGKTDLILGLALTQHQHSVIFRRQSTDLRGIEDRMLSIAGRDGWNGQDKILRRDSRVIELGHLEKPGAELSWQGRPHDLIGFDEGAQLARAKVQFVLGWLRSVNPNQRRRAIIASNPPIGGEGEWLVEWFAPWIDPRFPNPAKDGELRYAATAPDRDGTTVWLPDGRHIVFTGEREYRYATDEEIADATRTDVVQPLTRTFIKSWLRDNRFLAETGYRAQLQSLPEPMRSQLLSGDFLAGRQDHEWQVIPSAWVKAAQARWTPEPPRGRVMSAIAVDVAQGGGDRTVLAPRYGHWFAPLIERPGVETPDGSSVAGLVVKERRDGAIVIVDMGGGYGGAVKQRLEDNEIPVRAYNGANKSGERAKDSNLPFANMRSQVTWRFREALDPDQPDASQIALPPDPDLFAELTALRWKPTARGILIESKDELKKADRLGRSPDKGDAVITCWSEGERALIARVRKQARRGWSAQSFMPTPRASSGRSDGTGWMG